MMTVTFSTDYEDDAIRKKMREAAEKKMRELIRKKLTFPGSDKLSIKVTFGRDGKGKLTIVGEAEVTKEAIKRLSTR